MTRPGARERLVEATLVGLRERGVSGTGVADVLERSGTARGSLYQHFPDGKGALVVAAVLAAGDHVSRLLHRHSTADARFDALLRWWVDSPGQRSPDGELRGCPVAAAAVDADPDVRAAAAEVFDRWRQDIACGLTHLPADEANRLSGVALSALEGAVLQARATRDLQPLRDVRDVVTPLLR